MSLLTNEDGPLQSSIRTVMMKQELIKAIEHEILASEDVLGTISLMANKIIDQVVKINIKDSSLKL